MIKFINFDFDGVIANSDEFNIKALQFAADKIDINFTEEDFKKYFAGKTLVEGSNELFDDLNRPQEAEEFIKLKKSFDPNFGKESKLFQSTYNFIQNYKDNYRMAITSGARRILIDTFLEEYDLIDIFEFIIAAEDYRKGKPNPECYQMAREKAGLDSDEMIVIEDAPKGITAAKEAGLFCVAVEQTHKREKLSGADIIIPDLSKLKIDNFT